MSSVYMSFCAVTEVKAFQAEVELSFYCNPMNSCVALPDPKGVDDSLIKIIKHAIESSLVKGRPGRVISEEVMMKLKSIAIKLDDLAITHNFETKCFGSDHGQIWYSIKQWRE